jgi:hypothetical protein
VPWIAIQFDGRIAGVGHVRGEGVADAESPTPAVQYLAYGLPIGSWCWHDQRHPSASTCHDDGLAVLGTVKHGRESSRHFGGRHFLHQNQNIRFSVSGRADA